MGAMFVNNNRNKRVIALDVKSEEGTKIMRRLLAWSEVFLHNMRLDAIDRLGLTFKHVVEINPQIIYCAALGFGQGGRYRGRAAYDDVIQAASGLAGLSRRFGEEPRFLPTIIADKVGALHVVYGVLAALLWRARGNKGAINVEAPMFEALVSFLLNEHLAGATFSMQGGSVGYTRIFDLNRRPHRTQDGWIAVMPYTAEQWKRFFSVIGKTEINEEAWLADGASRSRRDWLSIQGSRRRTGKSRHAGMDEIAGNRHSMFEGEGFESSCSMIHIFRTSISSCPRATTRRLVGDRYLSRWFSAASSNDRIRRPPVWAGTRAMRQCGYDDAEVDRLVHEGIVRENIAFSPIAR